MSENPLFKPERYPSTTNLNPAASDNSVIKAGGSLLPLTADTRINDHTPEYYVGLGEKAYTQFQLRGNRQDLVNAIQYFGRAIEGDTHCTHARIQLTAALVDHQTLTLSQGIEQLEKMLQQTLSKTEQTRCWWNVGILYKRDNRLQKAIQAFCHVLSIEPLRYPKARFALASVFLQSILQPPAPTHRLTKPETPMSTTRTVSLLVQAIGQLFIGCLTLPFDTQACHQVIQASVLDSRINSVLGFSHLLNRLKCDKLSQQLLLWASETLPQEPVFYQRLGDDYLATHKPDAAIYYFIRAAELDDADINTHKKLAKAYLKCDDKPNAIKSLEKVCQLCPTDGEVLYDLAHLFAAEQNHMRALYYFKEAVKQFPKNPYIHSNMAYILFKLEDYTGAIEEYRLAIDYGTDPQWTATVAKTLGTIYHQLLEDKDQALEYFMLAHELSPNNLECMIMLADLYFEENQLQDALDLYEHIREMDPENPECHNYIGYLLWQMDRNDEAIQAYEQALAVDPDNATALNNLGVIYLDEEFNPSKALRLFEQALRIKPDYTLAAFNLGRTKEWVGERADAAKAYATAKQLNEENAEMADEEIQDRINQLFEM